MALSPKQRLWLHYYLTEANFNATEAARLAGYSAESGSARVQGARMLANVDVQAAVRQAVEARAMAPDEIIMRLSDIARGSLDDFTDIVPETDENGEPNRYAGEIRLNMNKARRRGLLHTFETIKETKYGTEVRRYSALDALDKLARVHKLFGETAVTLDVKVLNVVLDALPVEFREAVCAALGAEFQIAGDQSRGVESGSGDRADHPIGPEDPDQGQEADPAGAQ